uniref:Uncharacterized protein n=1 Tax=Acrobeloides nanus TaxID=290746 RepID=A0A914CJA1_9BILA
MLFKLFFLSVVSVAIFEETEKAQAPDSDSETQDLEDLLKNSATNSASKPNSGSFSFPVSINTQRRVGGAQNGFIPQQSINPFGINQRPGYGGNLYPGYGNNYRAGYGGNGFQQGSGLGNGIQQPYGYGNGFVQPGFGNSFGSNGQPGSVSNVYSQNGVYPGLTESQPFNNLNGANSRSYRNWLLYRQMNQLSQIQG